MNETYRQLSALSDKDLKDVFLNAKKIMSERGISDRPGRVKDFRVEANIDVDCYFSEDWSHLFDFECSKSTRYYVYIHVDPRVKRFHQLGLKGVGKPFYVGKGVGSRAHSKTRSKPHRDLISEILSEGYDMSDIVHIYKSDMDELSALELESKLINLFGCRCEMPKLVKPYISGRKAGLLINTDTGRRPDWVSNLVRDLNYSPKKAREIKSGAW
jgi:hypothetical protein